MDELSLLRKLGLTEYESKAYLALAKLGPSTVREIVRESKLPRNKAYEALQKLEETRKVVSLPTAPKKYKITNPEQFKEHVSELNTSVASLLKLIEQPKNSEIKEVFWILKGKKAIEDKLYFQNQKAKREILTCNKNPKLIYKNIRAISDAVKRDVKVKAIVIYDPKKLESHKAWMKAGAELRVFNEAKFGPLLPRITIFDSEVSRLTVGEPEIPNDEDYLTLWTESTSFSMMLKNHFMNMWRNSEPIEKYINKEKKK
ncbi:MAG: TrmB family transcriptional regulator [Candidatus Nanoarchaeia archaeon]